MKVKKMLCNFVSAIMAAAMLTSTVAYADSAEPETYIVYDDLGNEYTINKDEVLGVLYDKDGNIKEQSFISPQEMFYNGKMISLDPGDTFVTYQYTVQTLFYAGFYYYRYGDEPVTTPGGKLKISLRDSATIGGTRKTVESKPFSTTYTGPVPPTDPAVGEVVANREDANRPYYNAEFTNAGSISLSVCIFLGRN